MLEFKKHQPAGITFLQNKNRAILADDMGLGKTAQAIMACSRRLHIVVCPKHLLLNWQHEIKMWQPNAEVFIYSGVLHKRVAAMDAFKRDYVCPTHDRWLLVNYGLDHEISKHLKVVGNNYSIIYDEVHKLRNRKVIWYKTAKHLTRNAGQLFLITATPIVKHPENVIPLIMLLDRRYRSYWRLVERFFAIIKDDMTGWEVGPVKYPNKFRSFIGQYLLRRTKKSAGVELPDKQRRPLFLEMTTKQQAAYKNLTTQLIDQVDDDGNLLLVPNAMTLALRLRQLLVAPEILRYEFGGAALNAARGWFSTCVDAGHKCVIYTPFKAAIPHIIKSLGLTPERVAVLTGGVSIETRAREAAKIRDPSVKLAVGTIQAAEGYNLVEVSQALFIGADWNGTANFQAEDRIHRIGQEKPCTIYYTVHAGTIEENVFETIKAKNSYNIAMFKEHLLCQ